MNHRAGCGPDWTWDGTGHMHRVRSLIRPSDLGQVVGEVEDISRAEHIEALHILEGDDDHGTMTHPAIVHPRSAGVKVYTLTIPANPMNAGMLAGIVNGWPWRPAARLAND